VARDKTIEQSPETDTTRIACGLFFVLVSTRMHTHRRVHVGHERLGRVERAPKSAIDCAFSNFKNARLET
jgi:hypothetical protein